LKRQIDKCKGLCFRKSCQSPLYPHTGARRHLENILPVTQAALDQAGITLADLDGLAVTQGPGLIGALVIGMAVGKALAYTLKKPLAGVHHLQAHIAAIFLTDSPPAFPFVGLVVSGGHTNLYHVKSFQDMELMSRTRDDAAGEAFDKVAKVMGLGYPGGVVIEALATQGRPEAYPLPRPRIPEEPLTFSFSGLKTAVAYLVKRHPEILAEPHSRADLAASFQEAVVECLVSRAWLALEATGSTRLLVAGGVAANGRLRQALKEQAQATGMELFLLKQGERLPLSADVFSRG